MSDRNRDGDTRMDDPRAEGTDRDAVPQPTEERAETAGTMTKLPTSDPSATGVFDAYEELDQRRPIASTNGGKARLGDRIFTALTTGAAGFVILVVLLVAIFLVVQSVPSILDDKANFLFSTDWNTNPKELSFGVAALAYTTVLIALIALLFAVPVAIGIALFITQYAPRRVARPVANVIDLLAAIPSIIYGVWGIRVLAPALEPVQRALSHIGLGLFADQGINTGTVFDGGVVLAIMILPIITAISRDVFERTPTANREAALALGATRWEMVRMAVLPYGRAGVVSGSMLGLGRALGETIAVYLILSKVGVFDPSILSGGETIASKIALAQAEFGANPGPYIAAGLVLFVLTFVVNAAARAIVNRRGDFV
ncbi:MAG: phosphate ABC transporter permease subunit PstC [Jatrophihabitantaceae bacterium]